MPHGGVPPSHLVGKDREAQRGDLTCDHGRIQEEVTAGGMETLLGAGGLPSRTQGD